MDEIKRATGLVGFIVLGGPEPRCNGDLMVMSYALYLDALEQLLMALRAHTGTTSSGLDFSESYDGWKSSVEEPFVAHLNDIFCKAALLLFAPLVLTTTQHTKLVLPARCLKGQHEILPHCCLLRAIACLLTTLLAQLLLKKRQRKKAMAHMGLEVQWVLFYLAENEV